jgi:membrane protein
VEALRVSLNRAYRTVETRPWYLTRVISLFYVLVAVMVLAAVSIAFVAVPIAIRFTWEWLPWMARLLSLIDNWRIYVGIVTLLMGLLVAHLWLPAGRRKVGDVLPGIVLTLAFWLGGAWAFAAYLATFANYAATYAGLASLMIALIFLYIVGVIFIIGAEFNAALLKYRVRHIVSKRLSGSDHSQADTLPDRLR